MSYPQKQQPPMPPQAYPEGSAYPPQQNNGFNDNNNDVNNHDGQQDQIYQNGQPAAPPAAVVTAVAEASTWTTGICDCFQDMGSCCEVTWCSWCQASAQWNRANHGRQGCSPFVCLVVFGADVCFAGLGTLITAVLLRQRVRAKYSLEGSTCHDIVCGCCCAVCVLCQNYREMCVRGEHPGGVVCAKTPYAGPAARIQ